MTRIVSGVSSRQPITVRERESAVRETGEENLASQQEGHFDKRNSPLPSFLGHRIVNMTRRLLQVCTPSGLGTVVSLSWCLCLGRPFSQYSVVAVNNAPLLLGKSSRVTVSCRGLASSSSPARAGGPGCAGWRLFIGAAKGLPAGVVPDCLFGTLGYIVG